MVLAGVVLGEGMVRGAKSGDGEVEGDCDEIVRDATVGGCSGEGGGAWAMRGGADAAAAFDDGAGDGCECS
jgi:hypothetical protein